MTRIYPIGCRTPKKRKSAATEIGKGCGLSQQAVPNDFVLKSVAASGFAVGYLYWHSAKTDVYGGLFYSKWVRGDGEASDDADSAGIAGEFKDRFFG